MLQAGIAKETLYPRMGAEMIGYFNRVGGVAGVHDELHARALVLSNEQLSLAICAVEACIVPAVFVNAVRQQVSAQTGIPADHILIYTTHTHSAPALHMPTDWHEPPAAVIVRALVTAHERQQPARVGAGLGALHGRSINRRWLERPVDPCVGVIRVDDVDGQPIAHFGNFACHTVVLGPDNLLASGDWAGYAARALEAAYPHSVALISLGGAGDMNPLTPRVQAMLAADARVDALGDISHLYAGDPARNIGDRTGGTFEEAEEHGLAVAAEIMHVSRSIATQAEAALHAQSFIVDVGTPTSGQHLPEGYGALLPEIHGGQVPLPITLLRIGDALLVTHPVETFAEDAVLLRRLLQARGVRCPMLVTYAQGWYGYMPPAIAFSEGGYEVGWALTFGLRPDAQDLTREAVLARVV
ncbi:MAG: neutral/alkaline non-lysosomal ceramidase N-terminal domain-containing protein [Anaerolineae bacterium]